MPGRQESYPGGGWRVAALCWAGEVRDERQVTVASGRRSFGWRRGPDASTTRRWPHTKRYLWRYLSKCLTRSFTRPITTATATTTTTMRLRYEPTTTQAHREPQRGPGHHSREALRWVVSGQEAVPRKFPKIPPQWYKPKMLRCFP